MDTYFVIPNPKARIINDRVIHSGDIIPVELEREISRTRQPYEEKYDTGTTDILVKAGLMEEPKRILKGGLCPEWFTKFDKGFDAKETEERVNHALDLIRMPTGEEPYVVLKGKKKVPVEFRRTFDLDDTSKLRARLIEMSNIEGRLVAQEITKQIFGKGKDEYTLMSTPTSIELLNSDESLRKLATPTQYGHALHGNEIIFTGDYTTAGERVKSIGIASLGSMWEVDNPLFGHRAYVNPFNPYKDEGLVILEKVPKMQERLVKLKTEQEKLKVRA
jgi:hypothetical protein